MISEIISIVNLIAIIILFILYFTKKNTENFTGAPSGYTDLLVSDPDGNLDTFSLSKLETDIATMVTDAMDAYNTAIINTYQTKAEATKAIQEYNTGIINTYQTKAEAIKAIQEYNTAIINTYQTKAEAAEAKRG